MPSTRPPYPPQFCREAVELLRYCVALKHVGADPYVSEETLRSWRRHSDIDPGPPTA